MSNGNKGKDINPTEMKHRFYLPLFGDKDRQRGDGSHSFKGAQTLYLKSNFNRRKSPTSPSEVYFTPQPEATNTKTPSEKDHHQMSFFHKLKSFRSTNNQANQSLSNHVTIMESVEEADTAVDKAKTPNDNDINSPDDVVVVSCPTSPIVDLTLAKIHEEFEHIPAPPPANNKELSSMEKTLLKLMESFRRGELCALNQSTMRSMRRVRDQQEKLARLHFALYDDNNDKLSDTDEISDHKFRQLREGLLELQNSILSLKDKEQERESVKEFAQFIAN